MDGEGAVVVAVVLFVGGGQAEGVVVPLTETVDGGG